MGNCLVTKLKSVVDNDALSKLGEITIEMTEMASGYTQYSSKLTLSNGKAFELNAYDGAYFADNFSDLEDVSKRMTSLSINANTTREVYVGNANGKLAISESYTLKSLLLGKYGVTTFGVLNGFLNYSDGLVDFKCSVSGKIESIPENIVTFSAIGSSCIGNVSGFSSNTVKIFCFYNSAIECNISTLSIPIVEELRFDNSPNVTGHLTDVAGYTHLKDFRFSNSDVTGEIIDFVSGQVAAGKTPNAGMIFGCGSNATLNGKIVSASVIASGSLMWENASKIVFGWNTNTFANATRLYTYGYSAEEIAIKTASGGEWAGKQVIRTEDMD